MQKGELAIKWRDNSWLEMCFDALGDRSGRCRQLLFRPGSCCALLWVSSSRCDDDADDVAIVYPAVKTQARPQERSVPQS